MRIDRVVTEFEVERVRERVLQWSKQERYFMILDSNDFEKLHPHNNHIKWMAALGSDAVLSGNDALAQADLFSEQQKDWLFGHLSYDYKNQLEKLRSDNPDQIGFPELVFFQPACVVIANDDSVTLSYLASFKIAAFIDFLKAENKVSAESINHEISAVPIESPAQYKQKIETVQQHIHRGDIYELNYCTGFYAGNISINPATTYAELCRRAAAPMAVYYKIGQHHLISGSPERYIKKTGNRLISQPIKGTIRRSSVPAEDEKLMTQLEHSLKDKTENVMIVDLVRNDLSRIAIPGTVQVSELCKPYTFTHWHQLISTVRAEIANNISLQSVMQASFPMGSMTGAPKIRAMELIEELEEVKRGVYSGAVGYITPNGDFDFNVVIRSICYNETKAYLSYIVGGAITASSDPEKEYDECLLKAKGIEAVLNSSGV